MFELSRKRVLQLAAAHFLLLFFLLLIGLATLVLVLSNGGAT